MTLSEELQERGFVHQHSTATLAEIVDGAPRTVYWGIDPTAESMHAGNFAVCMLLHHLIKHGHAIVILVGGGTGMIGDPKPDVERPLTPPEVIAARAAKLRAQARHLFGSENVEFVDNHEWLQSLNLIEFLRNTGKHFTVNELIKKDAIAARLESESGISYTEFAYPLLQAYDYLMLYKKKGCDLQVGASDQWGNIIAGVELIRRTEGETVHALTIPLVVDRVTGKKFGKSEGNAIWLDPELTTPYQFYQFWFNTADENVIEYLKLFTLLPLSEIEEIKTAHDTEPGARTAQRRLAAEVTAFVHGAEAAKLASDVSDILFGVGNIHELNSEARAVLLAHAPVVEAHEGQPVVDLLTESGLAKSKNEARTLIVEGAVTLGGERVSEPTAVVVKSMFKDDLLLLTRGKRQVCVVRYNG